MATVKLTIIKKDGKLGSECPMEDQELVIGRRAPRLPDPVVALSARRAAPARLAAHTVPPSTCRDPDDCHIQIRLPEVSKKQAKIMRDDEHGQVPTKQSLCPPSPSHPRAHRSLPPSHEPRRSPFPPYLMQSRAPLTRCGSST